MFEFSALVEGGEAFAGQAALLEDCGYSAIYTVDSPINWHGMEVSMSLAVGTTRHLKIGALVTNPVTRHPVVLASFHASLHKISGGRALLGLGRGDSALRRMGERPATLKEFKARTQLVRALTNGEEVDYQPEDRPDEDWYAQTGEERVPIRFPWALDKPVPLLIAAYGPQILRWCGEVADGVILQVADIDTVRWSVEQVHAGARAAGRDPQAIRVICATPVAVDEDLHAACDRIRWFPGVLSNHVADMVRRLPREQAPANLLRLLEEPSRYDYREHARRGAHHADSVSDELVSMFGIAGPLDACIDKLRQLEAVGVTELCIYYLSTPEEEVAASARLFRDSIIPALR